MGQGIDFGFRIFLRAEDSRLPLMASAFVNTSARQVGAPRKSEVRDQKLMLRVELPVGAAFSRDLAH